MSGQLPAAPAGHWDTPEGREMALDYLGKSRASLCMGELSDLHLANKQYLEDISVGTVTFQSAIGVQTAAKERIRWLSAHLAAANLANEELLAVARDILPRNLCLTNPNVPDSTVVPLDVTMGELRKIAAVVAKAGAA